MATLTFQELNDALMRGDYIFLETTEEKMAALKVLDTLGWIWAGRERLIAEFTPYETPCFLIQNPWKMSSCPPELQYCNVEPALNDKKPRVMVPWNKQKVIHRFIY